MALRILIVDADPSSTTMIRTIAAPLGHVVLHFEDGSAAAQRAETHRFDVAFVGAASGLMNGCEVSRAIRDSEASHQCMIVMMSPTDSIENMQKSFSAGADLVMAKPLTTLRIRALLAGIASPGWRNRRYAVRLPLFTDATGKREGQEFALRTLNISATGILLQGAMEAGVGAEINLDFKIAEVNRSLSVNGRIVRTEEPDRFAVEFVNLAAEDKNAIQLYVMGRLTDLTPERDFASIGSRKAFHP